MKGVLILIGGALTVLGGVMFVSGWFGPHSGDGFENVGQIIVGLPLAVIGVILLAVGFMTSGAVDDADRPK